MLASCDLISKGIEVYYLIHFFKAHGLMASVSIPHVLLIDRESFGCFLFSSFSGALGSKNQRK